MLLEHKEEGPKVRDTLRGEYRNDKRLNGRGVIFKFGVDVKMEWIGSKLKINKKGIMD